MRKVESSFILLQITLLGLPEAQAATQDKSAKYATFQKAEGNCTSEDGADWVARAKKASSASPAEAYDAFLAEEYCRISHFKQAAEKNLDKFCPGVTIHNAQACYPDALMAFFKGQGLTAHGVKGMLATGSTIIAQLYKKIPDSNEKKLLFIEYATLSLFHLPNRVRPEVYSQKNGDNRDLTKINSELRDHDKEVATQFANALLPNLKKNMKEMLALAKTKKTSKLPEDKKFIKRVLSDVNNLKLASDRVAADLRAEK